MVPRELIIKYYNFFFICRPAETGNNVDDLPPGNNGDDPPPIEYWLHKF